MDLPAELALVQEFVDPILTLSRVVPKLKVPPLKAVVGAAMSDFTTTLQGACTALQCYSVMQVQNGSKSKSGPTVDDGLGNEKVDYFFGGTPDPLPFREQYCLAAQLLCQLHLFGER